MIDTFVTADIPPETSDAFLAWDEASLDVFARQPGFISATLYVSKDRTRLVTHLRWEREEDHWNCMRSRDFAALPPPPDVAMPQFVAHVYDVVGTREREPDRAER